MEKHIDTMGFILAAIVISITLIGDRETRRSEQQNANTRGNQDRLRELLWRRERVTPGMIADWMRQATVESDRVIVAARVLNTTLIVIVLVVGFDALRLLEIPETEAPDHAQLLVICLMLSAVASGAYGEVHEWLERTKAQHVFDESDLGVLARVGKIFHPPARRFHRDEAPQWRLQPGSFKPDALRKFDAEVGQLEQRYPEWELVSELRAIGELVRGDAPQAVDDLLRIHGEGQEGFNFPILLTAGITRSETNLPIELILPRLDELADSRGTDRELDELRFDLGLANAHESRMFDSRRSLASKQQRSGVPFAFDLSLTDVYETSRLRDFGRMWTDPHAPSDWRPDSMPDDSQLPISWYWQLIHDGEPSGGISAMREWRDQTKDASSLVSLGIACLAIRKDDDAVALFEAAIHRNSLSGVAHWGASLAYARASWTDRAATSLKRAHLCDFDPTIWQLTEAFFAGAPMRSYDNQSFVDLPTLAQNVQLSLIGLFATVPDDGTPRNRLAASVVDTARSRVAVSR